MAYRIWHSTEGADLSGLSTGENDSERLSRGLVIICIEVPRADPRNTYHLRDGRDSPKANGIAEGFVPTVGSECLDWLLS
jgi:hypothetical protein